VRVLRLEAEADELWSFVQRKSNKQWVWIAMDTETKQVIAFHVGDRSRKSAMKLWKKIPTVYRANATFMTDDLDSYKKVIAGELSVQGRIAQLPARSSLSGLGTGQRFGGCVQRALLAGDTGARGPRSERGLDAAGYCRQRSQLMHHIHARLHCSSAAKSIRPIYINELDCHYVASQ
jgi:IS1 family transposase